MAKTAGRTPTGSVRAALRVTPGSRVDLSAHDPRARPVGPRSKRVAADELAVTGRRLDALQEALYAEGTQRGSRRSVLLVLQGMDTSGKGGVIRHVAGLVNPQGLHIRSFGVPSAAERRHHYLWRIRRELPRPGRIGVFDRSHYEDVLVARVERLVPAAQWRSRFAEINAFEAEVVDAGTTLVKCFLHISPDRQRERLLARLDDPAKRWKYDPADLVARGKWDGYQRAYTDVLSRCNTDCGPWYVVPADRKWYRNWAVAQLLAETLEELDPQFPVPELDVAAERDRVLASGPAA